MVNLLPGYNRESTRFTEGQFVAFTVERYVLIGLYAFLMFLVIVNIWTILIKQRKYKTLPLLAFYIFAFFAISFRLVYIFMDWTNFVVIFYFIQDSYLCTKLGLGLIQSWMVLEIALRVRQTYTANASEQARAEAFEKWVRCGQYSVILTSLIIVLISTTHDLCVMDKWRDPTGEDSTFHVWAYLYLGMFFLMAAVNTVLICVMRERKKSAQRGSLDATYDFKKEACTLYILLTFFEISYLSRYLWDEFVGEMLLDDNFAYGIGFDASLYIDVLPFIGLLLFHYKNFNQSMSLAESTDRGQRREGSMNDFEGVCYL